ncbi:MAG TPA: GAF domain-containing sensor histidine kinase [Chloroflexota bacterium]|jgi:signal transduction histidine kinase|nr:GAF domain-containing sensor histidine kinase [Chloroflexota bacterium]
MLSRVTAGEVLERVVQALADMRSPDRLLAVILTETLRMLDAQGAYLLWLEGDRLRLRASAGLVPPGREAGVPLGTSIEGWVAQRGEAVAVANLASYARLAAPLGPQVGALLAVPMRLRGEIVGVLVATRALPGRFAESDRWWLSIFAEIGAVALENERLLDRERRRTREAEALAELAAPPTEPLRAFADRVAAQVHRVLGADASGVWVAGERDILRPLGEEPPGGQRARRAAGGRAASSQNGRQAHERGAPPTPLVDVYRTGEPWLCPDTAQVAAWTASDGDPALRSVLAVPLWVSGARRGVVWAAARRPGAFGPDDQTFLTLVAERIGLHLGHLELARQRAEIERREVEQRAKQDFLSVVSHELKTPVAVIKAYTEVLEGRAARGDAATIDRDLLARIGEQADRMLALVEQFLDLQRIEAGLMPLEESRFDLVELARRLVQSTQMTTSAHQLRVEASGPVYVRADRRRIEQVLQNLLDNAIKYSPKGGPVVVYVDTVTGPGEGERRARVRVEDRGVGIPAAALPRVFERFYQAGTKLVRGHVGLGLGLYISREIITRHGGEMGVESVEGQGSTFWFTLPLARAPQLDEDDIYSAPPAPRPSSGTG